MNDINNQIEFLGEIEVLNQLESAFKKHGLEHKRHIEIKAKNLHPLTDWLTVAGVKLKTIATAILDLIASKKEFSIKLEEEKDTLEITRQSSPEQIEKFLASHKKFKVEFKYTKE